MHAPSYGISAIGGLILSTCPLYADDLGPEVVRTVIFYHADHLGSTNCTTDDKGHLAAETYYYPFGDIRHEALHGETNDPHYRFGAKERDPESGLHYFEARLLAGNLGRFISADALYAGDAGRVLSTPQRLNLYSYVHNNPLAFTDPSGLQDAPVYTPGYDTAGYSEGFGTMVKVAVAGAIGTVVEFFGGSNTANAPESASAPTQDSQTTGEVAFRVATNVGFTKVVGKIAGGIATTERIAVTPLTKSTPKAPPPGEWVPVEIGKPIPGVKGPPISNPRLAAALRNYTPSTPAQQLANKGETLLLEHMTFGARRPAGKLLNMAQSGQRAQVGQLHQYFVGQHQHVTQAAANQGASKPMLDSLKNLADMTVPLSGK